MTSLNIQAIREQFPALNQTDLVYLDSAATSQKPQSVIDIVSHYYQQHNANVHRGSYSLTRQVTQKFEQARHQVARFIGAISHKEIIWTRGATEALNLIANSYACTYLTSGDEILIGEAEHHANIVPWQIAAQKTGAKIVKVPITNNALFDLDAFNKRINHKTKIVSLAHITNVTGARQPIEEVITKAHQVGAVVIIDGAQGIVHETINVHELDADFYVFSGHKLYAPNGIGVLYGKQALLEMMPPWQAGGKMVEKVSFEQTTYAPLPYKFEAGTPNVAGAIALATAIEWLQSFDAHLVHSHIANLQQQAYLALSQIDGIRFIGYQAGACILSFVIDGIHHQDIATLLDNQGIAIRAGHHCAHPLMDAMQISGCIRLSFAIYNNKEDVNRFVAAINKALELLL